ncbi:unnamed protein product [Didymodactylos carnosus]|uniref:Uncharacterized protein n=1 Tax=Didymodactylos carnosus TaxID=1234261 RepID=A0A813RRA4_9BILA|nr:unnamed protein product [Didymodactylos carnosus]CAF0788144.1 unnamed protein product [Didymodactylos carnosus]CAF3516433.1 unnamed protein product [Didymodactylos carnosus]CAF3572182.1 unnamed protein product [Didymodactylos carnosus]
MHLSPISAQTPLRFGGVQQREKEKLSSSTFSPSRSTKFTVQHFTTAAAPPLAIQQHIDDNDEQHSNSITTSSFGESSNMATSRIHSTEQKSPNVLMGRSNMNKNTPNTHLAGSNNNVSSLKKPLSGTRKADAGKSQLLEESTSVRMPNTVLAGTKSAIPSDYQFTNINQNQSKNKILSSKSKYSPPNHLSTLNEAEHIIKSKYTELLVNFFESRQPSYIFEPVRKEYYWTDPSFDEDKISKLEKLLRNTSYFVQSIFWYIRILLAILITIPIEIVHTFLDGLIKPFLTRVPVIAADTIIKPFHSGLFNCLILPIGIFLWNSTDVLARSIEPLFRLINILFEPCVDCFRVAYRRNGGRRSHFRTNDDNNVLLKLDGLDDEQMGDSDRRNREVSTTCV